MVIDRQYLVCLLHNQRLFTRWTEAYLKSYTKPAMQEQKRGKLISLRESFLDRTDPEQRLKAAVDLIIRYTSTVRFGLLTPEGHRFNYNREVLKNDYAAFLAAYPHSIQEKSILTTSHEQLHAEIQNAITEVRAICHPQDDARLSSSAEAPRRVLAVPGAALRKGVAGHEQSQLAEKGMFARFFGKKSTSRRGDAPEQDENSTLSQNSKAESAAAGFAKQSW